MENDINKILSTKRAWRTGERRIAERRKKYGTPMERKELADLLRRGRQQRVPEPWWMRLWRAISPLVLVIMFCGQAQAFTASWYSQTDAYIKPLMANGHIFNDRALTAASWRYPLGTWVRVTNVANGRSVVVMITDRGPGRHLYRKGRIVDLTRGAFQRLAQLKQGIIRIKITIP